MDPPIMSLFLLILTFSILSPLSLSLFIFSPADNHLIACGSTSISSFYNRHFLPDDRSSNPNSPLLSSSSSHSISLPGSTPSTQIYSSARIFTKPAKYAFLVKDPGTHIVRLHFHTLASPRWRLRDAVFHVLVDGYVVLSNFTLSNPSVKEYFIPSSSDKLVITFVPADEGKFGFVNAIEVISAPKDLIPDTATLLRGGELGGLTKQALETVYRVNVGGPKVTPFNDTLWRTWVPDDGFFKSGEIAKRVYFGGRIYYQKGGATRLVAPDFVYNTARVISSRNATVPKVNMTWEFPVAEGYKYLVRLHFCDIASIALFLINFNVYVDGYMAYERMDLTSVWYVLAAPIYRDLVVDGSGSGVLRVSIGPSNESIARNIDGMLNGVEILKMNNSMGSLDGHVCVGMVLRKWQRGNVGVLVPLLAVVCLLLSVSAILHRRSSGMKDTFAWTKLPTSVQEFNLKDANQQSSGKV